VEKLFSEYPILGRVLPRNPGRVPPRRQEKQDYWPMVPYGPISDEKWSRTHIYKKVMVQWVVRNGPNSYLMSITIHRFIDPVDRSRSIPTVDKDSPTGEYDRYRRSMPIHLRRITVDSRWSIKTRDNFVVDFIDDTSEKQRREKQGSGSNKTTF